MFSFQLGLKRNISMVLFLSLLLLGVWPQVTQAKKKHRKVHPRASLYVAQSPFPTSASTIKQLRYKAWKHRQRKLRWSKGSPLTFQIMLISKPGYSLKRGILHFVLFRPGVWDRKKYLAAEQLQVLSRTKIFTSSLTLAGRNLKKGRLYELRVIRIIGRRRPYERVIARTYFRLR